MDQIFDRLGNLLRSFVQEGTSTREYRRSSNDDPDIQDAWDELNEFLGGSSSAGTSTGSAQGGYSRTSSRSSSMPQDVRAAYEYLGVRVGTPVDEVSKVYKKLLREHHPDRFATNPDRLAEATERTKRINFAFQQIRDYHRSKARE